MKFGFEMFGVVSVPDSDRGIFRGEEIREVRKARSDRIHIHILIICGLRSQFEPLHVVDHAESVDGGQTQGGRLPPADFTDTFGGGGATLA